MGVVARVVASANRELTATDAMAAVTLGIAAMALLIARAIRDRPPIFEYLFSRDEPGAALLSCAIILAALFAAGRTADKAADRLLGALSRDPRLFIAGFTAVCTVAAVLVYRAHPLSMDEYAPLFQAGAFARGRLTGQAPPELIPRIILTADRWFLEASRSGEVVSAYWPGFALLLTPFVWLGCPWLLNPLIGGASLLVLWHLARAIRPETDAPGWAVLLAAASPAFAVDAISYYALSAHLLASMCFAALLLRPTPLRLIAAGALGSLALTLTNPLPHVLFALPWMVWLALQPGRIRKLSALALGYLPGTTLLFGGWLWVRSHMAHPTAGAGGALGVFGGVSRAAFAAPTWVTLWNRTIGMIELALWAVPALLPLACLGFWRFRHNRIVRLLAASAATTLLAYLIVAFDQGHGWGYRYFHSAWGVLPLLGACAVTAPKQSSLRRLALAAAFGSLLLGNALRFVQVRTFIDGHLAQIPEAPPARFEIVFVRTDRGYYSQDLVQNDPFMEGRRWILFSFGRVEDERFLQRSFPTRHARLAAASDVASVWQLD